MQDDSMVLAARETPPGWINLAIGTPEVVFDAVDEFLVNVNARQVRESAAYPPAAGTPDLIEAIRRYPYGGPDAKHIVVANGARQALLAAIYAITKTRMTRTALCAPAPYWPSHRSAAKLFGLEFRPIEPNWWDNAIYVNTAPNNPDGAFRSSPCDIWDAAYYHPVYGPENGDLPPLPPHTVSCWSGGKILGLPGLRVGWLKTDEGPIAKYAAEYVELTTSGISLLSQSIARQLLTAARAPSLKTYFVDGAKADLDENRRSLYQALGLDVPSNPMGMFAWLPDPDGNLSQVFERAKIMVSPGDVFGRPEFIRVSLGASRKKFIEAIGRLEGELC